MASRHGIVSAEAAEDLRGATRALRSAPSRLRDLIDLTGRQQLSDAWGQELHAGGGSKAQQKFVAHDPGVIPQANSVLAYTGGDVLTKPYEFGTNDRDAVSEYDRKNRVNGGTHRVKRRTRRQLPERKPGGWLAYPAANRYGSRVFQMWGALINKILHDSYEGKG